MNKVIVTGASGFIGTALVKELINQKVKVFAVIREGSKYPNFFDNNKDIVIINCSMDEYHTLPSLIKEKNFDALYHLAWEGTSGPLRSNYSVQIKNIRQSCNLVEVSRDLNCKKIVFAASIMEYEIQSLINADIMPNISSIYSIAKMSADYMMKTMASNYKIDYIRAIISNVYGPGELSPRIINTSLRKLINGEHCSFSSGEQMYDFIYISDAAKEFYIIGEKGKGNKSYYIGSLRPKPLKEFLLEMKNLVNPNIEIGLGELPFCGVSLKYDEFDIFAIRDDTGFVPEVTFTEGINRTIEWVKSEKKNS